jgi:GTP-binding protein HflX
MDGTERERVVVAAVDSGAYDIEASLKELRALCDSAGADVVGEVVQRRGSPDRFCYLGSGKAGEARELCEAQEAGLLVVDDELSGTRLRNLEDAVGVAVIDRTALILDIFARAATTAEGKLQVELAQLSYRLPRLAGAGVSLSRLGGGIGTRGPGESKLETDRRYIRARIKALKARLETLEKRRGQARRLRAKAGTPVVALAGYTNVGKSSLLNALTGAEAPAEDRLFATLDPTARRMRAGGLGQAVVVDTVGFVSRLPHTLVDAFKSTLEEIKRADLAVIVADASTDAWREQLEVAGDVLAQLDCSGIPSITVFNKCDLTDTAAALPGLPVSAKTGYGLDRLADEIFRVLSERSVRCAVKLPFDRMALAALIRERGSVISEAYEPDGVAITARVDRELYGRIAPYAVD